jgi:hypothetical protein
MMILKKYSFLIMLLLLAVSCGRPGSDSKETGTMPAIYPDYKGVTVPVNIAPLNFRLLDKAEKVHVSIKGKNGEISADGKAKIRMTISEWRKLLKENADDSLKVTVYACRDRNWYRYSPFSITIKSKAVDPWLVYRLIAPGYESWSEMGIYQRNLTSFESEPIIDNRLLPGACMNCHSFRANSPDDMMFHLRGNIGATILVQDGNAVRLNTKIKETISNCVYPYWHPSGNYIAFSVNAISQVFHSVKEKRIEVFDSKSDLVVYDIKNNKLITSRLISSDESFETFPAFSPDGTKLFFCSAGKGTQPDNYDRIKYSLCRIDFDAATGTFGNTIDTLVSSFKTGRSVSFPRVSPDGKHLVFTLSDYGNFSIWHRDADLYQLDLSTGAYAPATALNSNETESYHSWSSNSRWMVFSSRRDDGLYTRPFIAWFDESGSFSKPFMVPQADPDYYEESLRSFNIPEFVTGKVKSDGRSMLKAIDSPAKNINFELKN